MGVCGWVVRRRAADTGRWRADAALVSEPGAGAGAGAGRGPQADRKVAEAYSAEDLQKLFAAATPEDRLLFEFFLACRCDCDDRPEEPLDSVPHAFCICEQVKGIGEDRAGAALATNRPGERIGKVDLGE